MKKYLIKGLLALVVGGFTASCADKDVGLHQDINR